MPHHILFIEMDKRDSFDPQNHVACFDEPGAFSCRQIDLCDIARDHGFAVISDSGEEHLHLLGSGVLCLVENHERVIQSTAAHKRDWRDFDDAALEVTVDSLDVEHVIQRVVEWFQIRIDLFLQRPRQEAEPFPCFYGWPREYNTIHLFFEQGSYRHTHSKIGLAGTSRTDA